ncbi:hypothetical protein [Microbacterium sp. PA5]|uniref:hypothetical protein n=1 Tax=Microbacterium sp. PA5 TaxID=3416654 RepID=UPI003CF3ABDA
MRRSLAVALIVVGVVLTPVAAVGAWVRVALVDTDRFVEALAPLADDPAVQGLVIERTTAAIESRIDVDGLVGDLFGGLATLDLPPRAAAALPLLESSAVAAVQALIERTVTRVVESDAFASTWTTVLRTTHDRGTALLTWDGSGVVGISEDSVLELHLGPVVGAARQALLDEGLRVAAVIPEVSLVVPLGQADSVVLARTAYAVAVAVGAWLPWLALALLAGGVLLARRRVRAVSLAAAGAAASLLLTLAAVGIARRLLRGASGDAAPALDAIADAVLGGLTGLLTLLAVVAVIVAVAAWSASDVPSAAGLRARAAALSGRRRAAAPDGAG